MTHRHSCSRSVFVGKSLDIILSGDGKIDIIRYNYHVYTSVQSVPPKDFMSGKDANTKDANTMKKHIGRFLSVLLCLQLLFGMIPLPGLDEHDHDHEHGLGGIVLPVNAWDTTSECEFCEAFIADDYICGCGEGGDHCSAESGRSCYEDNHCGTCNKGVGADHLCDDCGTICAGNDWCSNCNLCGDCTTVCEGCAEHCSNCVEWICSLCRATCSACEATPVRSVSFALSAWRRPATAAKAATAA